MKLSPTWQGIPFEIKEDIVNFLDYKSRFCLQGCSKSDLHLVDNCPFFLEQVEIRDNILHIKDHYGTVKIKKNIFSHFLSIFKQRRSTVKSVILSLDGAQGANFGKILANFSFQTFKIRAKSAYFYFDGVDNFPQIFKIFDSKSISFRQIIPQELLEQLVKTDTWKNAKQIFCYGRQDVPLDTVSHLDTVRYFAMTLNSEDAEKLINSFTSRENLMPGFGFRVNYSSDQVALNFPANLDNSYNFPTNAYGLNFTVKLRKSAFGNHIIEGYACNDFQDFKKFSNFTPEDHLQVNRRLMDQLPFLPPWGMLIRSIIFAADH